VGLELKGDDMPKDFELDEPTGETEPTVPVMIPIESGQSGTDSGQELSNPVQETEPTVPVMIPIEPGQSGTDSGQELSNPVQGTGPKPPISMGWVARSDTE
jgi:hypothetical protein